ncbi:MAG: hypothetical protein H2172_18265 [Opitutus sp.]|nr:hypothetical protein [Opitutus sp.]MCS6248671.1 hypothetical protein [Opitutus sp.]MCS6275509.1 hypothetical protein [Opitutus sp.]MCS6278356.1 hypothetical protein [Opitutus sp.]MCS6299466.1 hypothetical protein [Opitutus sp.]
MFPNNEFALDASLKVLARDVPRPKRSGGGTALAWPGAPHLCAAGWPPQSAAYLHSISANSPPPH